MVAIGDGGMGLPQIAGDGGFSAGLGEANPAGGILTMSGTDDGQLFGREGNDVAILGAEDGGHAGDGFFRAVLDLDQVFERGNGPP